MMGHRWSLAVACVMCAGSTYGQESAGTAQAIFDKVQSSVVTVRLLDEQSKPVGQGSGVVVGRGLIATNCHVVHAAAKITVQSAQGEHTGRWTRRLPGQDLCLVEAPALEGLPVRLRDSTSLAVGETIHAVGNPLGFGLAVSSGLISTVRRAESAPYLLVAATAPVSPGSSGGGLFDTQGRLVGLTTAIMGTGQNLNRIIATDAISDLMAKGEAPPAPMPLPVPEVRWREQGETLLRMNDTPALQRWAVEWQKAQPTAAMAWALEGTAQLDMGETKSAERLLRRALELDPALPFGWRMLGKTLYKQGRLDEAEAALQQAERGEAYLGYTDFMRAEWLRAQRKLPQAQAQMREALRKEPSYAGWWRTLADIESDLGNVAQASRARILAQRLDRADLAAQGTVKPDGPPGVRDEGRIQLSLGIDELEQGRLGPAEDALRKAVALLPENWAVWINLGNVLRRTNRLDKAEEAYSRAVEFAPREPVALLARAELRWQRQQIDLALADAQQMTDRFREYAHGWRMLARLQSARKMYPEANVAHARLESLAPLTVDDLVDWASDLVTIGDSDGALKLLQRAEALEPKKLRMLTETGRLLGRKGDMQAALTYFDRALAVDPLDVTTTSAKGYALMKLRQLPQAVELLETSVRLDPSHVNSWINLGEAQMQSGNLRRAIQALEKALELAPTAVDAKLYLAQSYLAARLPVKAREWAGKLLEQQPRFAMPLVVMVMSYMGEGNITAAAESFGKLKVLSPPAAQSLRERLVRNGVAGATSLPE